MSNSSKNFMAVLLILTIVISLIGTMAALSHLAPYKEARVYEHPGDLTQTEGKVTVYVEPEPASVTGHVTVAVVPTQEGG